MFSVCDACPELPSGDEDSGPATVCDVRFSDELDEASVLCLYGPGGRTSSGIANDAVKGIPNVFGFCENRCPEDALNACSLLADESGVTELRCHYGESCD